MPTHIRLPGQHPGDSPPHLRCTAKDMPQHVLRKEDFPEEVACELGLKDDNFETRKGIQEGGRMYQDAHGGRWEKLFSRM